MSASRDTPSREAPPRATFPVQNPKRYGQPTPQIAAGPYLAAYEVYCYVYGSQTSFTELRAMIEGGCRGGFGVGEIIAFLYARSFPQEQWRQRVDEAFKGMNLDG